MRQAKPNPLQVCACSWAVNMRPCVCALGKPSNPTSSRGSVLCSAALQQAWHPTPHQGGPTSICGPAASACEPPPLRSDIPRPGLGERSTGELSSLRLQECSWCAGRSAQRASASSYSTSQASYLPLAPCCPVCTWGWDPVWPRLWRQQAERGPYLAALRALQHVPHIKQAQPRGAGAVHGLQHVFGRDARSLSRPPAGGSYHLLIRCPVSADHHSMSTWMQHR